MTVHQLTVASPWALHDGGHAGRAPNHSEAIDRVGNPSRGGPGPFQGRRACLHRATHHRTLNAALSSRPQPIHHHPRRLERSPPPGGVGRTPTQAMEAHVGVDRTSKRHDIPQDIDGASVSLSSGEHRLTRLASGRRSRLSRDRRKNPYQYPAGIPSTGRVQRRPRGYKRRHECRQDQCPRNPAPSR